MGYIVGLFIGLVTLYIIYKERHSSKLVAIIICFLLIINNSITVTYFPLFMPVGRWLIYSLLFVCFLDYRLLKSIYKIFPLKLFVTMLIVGSFYIGFLDPRLSLFNKLYMPFQEIIETYFILVLSFFSIKERGFFEKNYKLLTFSILIISLFGLYNFLSRTNPYYAWVIATFSSGGVKDTATKLSVLTEANGRFRATSTFNMTFNYGYISSLMAIWALYMSNVYRRKDSILLMFFSIIGVVLCYSRLVLLSFFMSLMLYIFLSTNMKDRLKYVFLITVVCAVGYFSINEIKTTIDNSVDIITTGGENTEGSSVNLRIIQFAGSLKYFLQSPVRGNGYGYIIKELGWGDRDNAKLDKDLAGFESFLYKLMIEQGIVGLVTKSLFFLSILYYFIHNFTFNKQLCSLGLSIHLLFLLFIFGTGALGSWSVTMLFLGAIIKEIEMIKYELFEKLDIVKI